MRARHTLHFSIFVEMNKDYRKRMILLMAVSLLFRSTVAVLTELGNDEVYYWTYALFPDWSHFDHPPMLGWIIQLFTCNLRWDSSFALRLPSLVLGTLNTWLIYRLGNLLKGPKTGWYSALLYTGSLYAAIIAGTFVMPDTPLSTFYLAALYSFFKAFGLDADGKEETVPVHFLWAGLFTGMAMLSKYSGIFLWVGAMLYVMFYRRKTLKEPWLWAGMTASLLLFLPVLIWNLSGDMSSFAFHSERISFWGEGLNPFYFLREVSGLFLYNNPVNVFLMIWSLCHYTRHRRQKGDRMLPLERGAFRMIMTQSVPIIALFLFFSLFRETLPHWSAPGFYSLILLAAAVADHTDLRWPVTLSPAILAVVVLLSLVQIRTGFIPLREVPPHGELSPEDPSRELGRFDFTLDMYGWTQLGNHFKQLKTKQETLYLESEGRQGMPQGSAILATRWFPGAHIDYYVARPAGTVVKTTGPLQRTHKYEQITRKRGGIAPKEPLYYIESSRFPENLSGSVPLDTFFVQRSGKPVIRYVVHRISDIADFRAE